MRGFGDLPGAGFPGAAHARWQTEDPRDRELGRAEIPPLTQEQERALRRLAAAERAKREAGTSCPFAIEQKRRAAAREVEALFGRGRKE